MQANWITRRYGPGDEELILKLRNEIRGATHSGSYWRSRYVENPCGQATIWLALSDGMAVGHSAMIPTSVNIDGRTVKAGLSVDAWTHPDFRCRGVFTSLHRSVLQEARNQGIEFAYTFPNDESYRGFLKLGYNHPFSVPALRKVVNWGAVLKGRTKIPLLDRAVKLFLRGGDREPDAPRANGVNVSEVMHLDERFDALWSRQAKNNVAAIVRDRDYISWRYLDNPRYDYMMYVAESNEELLGYVVLNTVETDLVRGYIVDMLLIPNDTAVFRALLDKSIEHLTNAKADTIHIWMPCRSPYYRELKKRSFRSKPNPVRFCCKSLSSDVKLPQRPEQWWLCPGDYDL